MQSRKTGGRKTQNFFLKRIQNHPSENCMKTQQAKEIKLGKIFNRTTRLKCSMDIKMDFT